MKKIFSTLFILAIFLTAVSAQAETAAKRFGFLSQGIGITPKAAKEMGVSYLRPHPGQAVWNDLEPTAGEFNWDSLDETVLRAQKKDLNLLVTIWPFADWDQKVCHKNSDDAAGFEYELPLKRDVPCDFAAYRNFLTSLVERYDYDGQDDMPGLLYKVKYWEVLNEPEMTPENSPGLIFFQGTAKEYAKILKQSYTAIKAADGESGVLLGGMAGTNDSAREFWADVFKENIKNYFDIGNIHSINSANPSLNARYYKKLLADNNISKPFWITEVQITSETQANDLVQGYTRAFKAGAQKIFYTIYKADNTVSDDLAESALIYSGKKKQSYYAFAALADKVDGFTKVVKVAEGQYKFKVADEWVYVLWGKSAVPQELVEETLEVTDLYGQSSETAGSALIITEEPIFVTIK